MQNMDDYVQIMIESLEKKSELLDKLIRKNKAQAECVSGKEFEDVDWEAFDLLVTEKEITINKINTMDEGFQSLYDRVKEQLNENKDRYKEQIKRMQELVGIITDQGVEIRTGEERNRQIIDKIFGSRKKVIKQTRNSLKVAQSYFQTMQNHSTMDINMMDKKK